MEKKIFKDLESGNVFKSTNPDLDKKTGIVISTVKKKNKNHIIFILYDDIVETIDEFHFMWNRETFHIDDIDVTELQLVHNKQNVSIT